MSKGNDHFWPAYVDMMTVLLLVYILISMVFQVLMVLAKQNEGIKLNEQQTYLQIHHISSESQYPESKELRLPLKTNQNHLGNENESKLVNWIKLHREAIKANGVTIFSANELGEDQDIQTGISISLQYDRGLDTLRIFQEEDLPINVRFNNSIINISDKDFVAIRIKDPVPVSAPLQVQDAVPEQEAVQTQ